MNEYALQRKLKKLAEDAGVLFYKMEAKGKRGFPDVLLLANGRSVYIELKSPKGTGKLSALQTRRIEEMKAAGADVRVIDNLEGCIDVINEIAT